MLYHHLQKLHLTRRQKSCIIKDLGKSLEIKDLANSLILNEKFFRLKSSSCAERNCARVENKQVQKLRALAPALSSEKST